MVGNWYIVKIAKHLVVAVERDITLNGTLNEPWCCMFYCMCGVLRLEIGMYSCEGFVWVLKFHLLIIITFHCSGWRKGG